MRLTSWAMCVAVCGLLSSPWSKGNAAEPIPAFLTRHAQKIGEHTIHYAATAGWTDLPGPDGKPWEQVFSVAYTRTDISARRRPVLFLFNGGPGASSAFLQLVALGPRRLVFPRELAATGSAPAQLEDNRFSPLAVADLVFIDPPETGYSHTLPADAAHEFASIEGDARFVAEFIRSWLATHHREESPTFILGESYGATRASLVASLLAENSQHGLPTPISGLILVSQFLTVDDLGQRPMNAQGYATYLPSMAAVAWFHEKVDRRNRAFDVFESEVRAFALDVYLPALMRGDELNAGECAAVAAKLSSLTGIDAQYLIEHRLKLTVTEFRQRLLPGRLLGNNDGRYTAPSPGGLGEPLSAISEDPKNDPSWVAQSGLLERAISPYFTQELDIHVEEPYKLSNEQLGRTWNFGSKFRAPASQWLVAALEKHPRMQLFLASGRHDLLAPFGETRYLLSQLNLAQERGELHIYDGGHLFYTEKESLERFADDLQHFITRNGQPSR
jgi:carboxypeptidase C (cathepsin A)